GEERMMECVQDGAHDDYQASAGALQKSRQLIVDLLGEEIRHHLIGNGERARQQAAAGAKREVTLGLHIAHGRPFLAALRSAVRSRRSMSKMPMPCRCTAR